MTKALLVSLLSFGCGVASIEASPIAGPLFNPATGHYYYLLSQNDWKASEADAVSLGGHLVTINSKAEQDWVFTTFGFYGNISRSLWIGLNDQTTEGVFTWTSGEPVTYTRWNAGEPNNGGIGGPNEDATHMWQPDYCCGPGASWNDRPETDIFADANVLNGVAELSRISAVPESTAGPILGLAAFSALILLHFTRRGGKAASPLST